MDEELRFHLAMREEELRAGGMDAASARAEAARLMGDADGARRYCREVDARRERRMRGLNALDGWRQDVQFAVRQLRRSPVMTVAAVLTLALGIGATTAIFSAVHRLIIDPVPYPDGDRLVWISQTWGGNQVLLNAPPALVQAWRAGTHSLDAIGMSASSDVTVGEGVEAQTLTATRAEPELLALLGGRPILGRTFARDEMVPGGPPVAVIGYGLWQNRFGGARDVIGGRIIVDGRPVTVIGVLPRDFELPSRYVESKSEIVLPLVPDTALQSVEVVGRLRPGVTTDQARRDLDRIRSAYIAATGRRWLDATNDFHTAVERFRDDVIGHGARSALLILLGAVAFVLLIACVNIANLLLARAALRAREFAVRAALGAGRGRLVRQLLTESLLLAALGGVAGLVVAQEALGLIIARRPPGLGVLSSVRLDGGMLAFGLGVAACTGLLFGLAPALLASEGRVGDALKAGGRSLAGHAGARRLRTSLAVAEIALSVVLLIGAGLLLRTVREMQRVDLGFDPRGLVALDLVPPKGRYTTSAEREALWSSILERVRGVPGVQRAVIAGSAPWSGGVMLGTMTAEGRAAPIGGPSSPLGVAFVPPDYFATTRLPIVAGRTFTPGADSSNHELIINDAMARSLWPRGTALGRRIRPSANGAWSTVIGVAHDVTLPGTRTLLGNDQIYLPFRPDLPTAMLIARQAPGAAPIAKALVAAVRAREPALRIRSVATAESELASGLAPSRFNMTLLSVFALIALVLAGVGLYGVIAYSVSQRTREFGVRMALGASPGAVQGGVVRHGAALAVVGTAIGVAAAAATTRVMRSLLFGVQPLDPLTFGGVALLLCAIAVLASWLPARRAARIDPAVALQAE